MDDRQALKQLKKGDEQALCLLIDRYTGYITTVIGNILGPALTADRGEELLSDVFFALWQGAGGLHTHNLKAWLASVARNKAKDLLRSSGQELSLEEDLTLAAPDDVEREIWRRECARRVNEALLSLEHPDREIFYRYYYFCQPVRDIGEALDMNPATVKTRLHRGRKVLKEWLTKGGFMNEAQDI